MESHNFYLSSTGSPTSLPATTTSTPSSVPATPVSVANSTTFETPQIQNPDFTNVSIHSNSSRLRHISPSYENLSLTAHEAIPSLKNSVYWSNHGYPIPVTHNALTRVQYTPPGFLGNTPNHTIDGGGAPQRIAAIPSQLPLPSSNPLGSSRPVVPSSQYTTGPSSFQFHYQNSLSENARSQNTPSIISENDPHFQPEYRGLTAALPLVEPTQQRQQPSQEPLHFDQQTYGQYRHPQTLHSIYQKGFVFPSDDYSSSSMDSSSISSIYYPSSLSENRIMSGRESWDIGRGRGGVTSNGEQMPKTNFGWGPSAETNGAVSGGKDGTGFSVSYPTGNPETVAPCNHTEDKKNNTIHPTLSQESIVVVDNEENRNLDPMNNHETMQLENNPEAASHLFDAFRHVVGSQGRRGILPTMPGKLNVTPSLTLDEVLKQVSLVDRNENERFTCPYCNRSYLHKKHLQRHAVRHISFRPYGCCLCKDSFARSDVLKRHFQKCSVRRGNPTGASHLDQAHDMRRATMKNKQQQQQQQQQQEMVASNEKSPPASESISFPVGTAAESPVRYTTQPPPPPIQPSLPSTLSPFGMQLPVSNSYAALNPAAITTSDTTPVPPIVYNTNQSQDNFQDIPMNLQTTASMDWSNFFPVTLSPIETTPASSN